MNIIRLTRQDNHPRLLQPQLSQRFQESRDLLSGLTEPIPWEDKSKRLQILHPSHSLTGFNPLLLASSEVD